MTKGSWGASKRSLAQVDHISHDWLTPCEYLPYIDALLKNIDLDPCSTYDANNQFLRAEKIYTYEIDGLNIEEPWTGKTYLFPPTYGRCSFAKKEVHGDGVYLQVMVPKLPLLYGLEDY